jgi:hypothetical protein
VSSHTVADRPVNRRLRATDIVVTVARTLLPVSTICLGLLLSAAWSCFLGLELCELVALILS